MACLIFMFYFHVYKYHPGKGKNMTLQDKNYVKIDQSKVTMAVNILLEH